MGLKVPKKHRVNSARAERAPCASISRLYVLKFVQMSRSQSIVMSRTFRVCTNIYLFLKINLVAEIQA